MQEVGMIAHAPNVLVKDGEAAKYRKMWDFKEYRNVSPAEQIALEFLKQAKPFPNDTCIDFGTGTGRGAMMLALIGRMKVTMLDFADNCLDDELKQMLVTQSHALSFHEADLREPIEYSAKYGFCVDVMEHIPTDDVDKVLHNILKSAQHVFFQISLLDDAMGALIGEPLHLTVKPFAWWLEKIAQHHQAQIHWVQHNDSVAMFYCSSWNDASEIVKIGTVNTLPDEIKANIRSSVQRGLDSVKPYDRQDTTVILLAGGASLADYEDEIRAKRESGLPLITLNGSYNWAIEHGMTPSVQIMVDAREFNNRFVSPQVDTCRYLIASQCHPSVFDALNKEQTLLWHAGISEEMWDYLDELHKELDLGSWFPIAGGSTVMLRALPLLRMLGYWRFEIYGFDSCLLNDAHHAYPQPENDSEVVVDVTCGGQVFKCHAWQVSQAQEFMDLMKIMATEIELVIHGEGLIHHIIETASLDDEEDLDVT